MPTPLLQTKLQPPPVRHQQQRPRLDRRIETGVHGRLTLVSAPAGYGKTTAVLNWLAHTKTAVAWLSLDEADNAPDRFLRHVVAALQGRDDTLRDLGDFVGDDLEAALITVVNDLAANDEPLVLVLDDYHVIRAERVHTLVRFLLDHGPTPLRLLLTTRVDPPLPLARLRVARSLTEVRSSDLRFGDDEARAWLAALGLELGDDDVHELVRRTEGWAAGLQLAALSLQGRQDAGAFIDVFTGTDRYVLAYLTEEVLLRQPQEVQDFLLLSSVLERFDATLAAAVTGMPDTAAMIDHVDRHNLFLVALDDRREDVRYHAFFQDLLSQRLRMARPDLIPELHRRAARHLSGTAELPRALRHAWESRDLDLLADLLEGQPAAAQEAGIGEALKQEDPGTGVLSTGAADVHALAWSRIRRALAHGSPTGARSGQSTTVRGSDDAGGPLPEPLSERELEVLRLITAGLSNKAIARRLGLSPNTIKTHARNAYGKLDVSSRTEAAARARELGLV